MTKLRLYGKKPRCWWCGKPIIGEARERTLEFGGEKFECIVCSFNCETASVDASRYVDKLVPLFIGGIVLSLLLTVLPSFSLMISGFVLLGATILICPICIPQTTKALGMRTSVLVGRIIGCIMITVALSIWMNRN